MMDDRVRTWLESRTYAGTAWSAEDLVRRKAGTTVSVVLPAKDEAATVGRIVRSLRQRLMLEVPLLDELVVIDACSRDGTAAVATAAGATVHHQADILTDHGDRPGKGEALWKSLAVTSGDLVAFIDADLRNFDPQFAVGLLGPLLTDDSVEFVKAFYDRPLADGGTLLPAGGGRVTEILARPLLNLHWPHLAGFVQPLAGEYAARRTLIEDIPFASGYGVEVAMLVDVSAKVGLDAMAQVDLGSRTHRNSSDAALGRMACEVYLAARSRLDAPGEVEDSDGLGLLQFVRHGDAFTPRTTAVETWERPPMRTLRAGSPAGAATRSVAER